MTRDLDTPRPALPEQDAAAPEVRQGSFTPGPWVINADSPVGRELRSEVHVPGYASIDSDVGGFYGLALVPVSDEHGEPIDESFANAQLIAAAPDMLEALRLVEIFSKGNPHPADERGWELFRAGVMHDVRAAIAKAEGRS